MLLVSDNNRKLYILVVIIVPYKGVFHDIPLVGDKMKDEELIDNFLQALKLDEDSSSKYEMSSLDSNSADRDSNDILKMLQQEKIGILKPAIDDIIDLIKMRQELTEEIFRDTDKIKMDVNNFIHEFGDQTNTAQQLQMRQKQVEIEEVKIQEKINSWRDIAALKKELRERLKEFKDKESKAGMLDNLLE